MIAESLLKLAAIEEPTHPFPGLRPFEFHENHLFFGRDGQSEQVIARLGGTRFVAVVGTSGSGKSSLVRAGFLPALFGGLMAHAGSSWRAAIMRPGNDPIANLARALNADGDLGAEDPANATVRLAMTEAILRRGSLGLIEAFRQGELAVNEKLLVLVDQFEELFRIEAGSEDNQDVKAAFVKLLLEARDQRELPIYVVLTMRSDYLGDCAQFRDLPEAINQGQYLIPRMTREERRSSITGPVAVGGAAITPRLVNRLLNDVGDNPDQLPILQHALMRTWDRWKQDAQGDDPIDLRHYEAIGGLSEALSLHADEAYDELPESRRALAERIFRSLTEKGRDNREVRRPLTVRDICTVTSADEPEVIAVVETFRRADRSFLMPSAEVGLTADSLIDISHESLIRNWKRLKAWVEDEAQSAAIYRRLAETAVLHGEGGAGLWRDPDLEIALHWRERVAPNAAWARRYHPGFAEANGFLEESLALREAEAREKEERRRRELTRARIFAEILGLAFLISVGLALYGNQKRKEALEQTDLAIQQRKVAEERERSNRQLFYVAQMNLAQKAFSEGDSGRGNEHLNTALPTAADAPRDERGFGWYLLWQLHHHEKATLAGPAGRVSSVAFAPDGKTLASGSQEGTVKLWDVATRRALATLKGGAGNVASIAFAPDGKVLAVGSTDGTIKLWDVATRRQVAALKGHSKWVTSVVFAPDGKTLASGARDGAVKLWGLVGTHQELATFRGPADWVYSVAFAPDGKTLASAGDDGTVKLWDVVTGQALATFKGHPDGVFSVAFTPDGKALTAGSAEGAVRLWDVRTGQDLATFGGHAGGALAVCLCARWKDTGLGE